MLTTAVQITADDREARCLVIEELRRMDGVVVRIAHLAQGDYRVRDALLVERKTLVGSTQPVNSGTGAARCTHGGADRQVHAICLKERECA